MHEFSFEFEGKTEIINVPWNIFFSDDIDTKKKYRMLIHKREKGSYMMDVVATVKEVPEYPNVYFGDWYIEKIVEYKEEITPGSCATFTTADLTSLDYMGPHKTVIK